MAISGLDDGREFAAHWDSQHLPHDAPYVVFLLHFSTAKNAGALSLDKTLPRDIMKIQKGAVDLTVGPKTF